MVAVVQAGDATDLIPLLDNNGSGVYNKGRNNKQDFQRHFIGGMFGKNVQPFDWRTGVLSPSTFSGSTPQDGMVQQSGGGAGTQAVVVKAHRSLLKRSNGPSLWAQEADVVLNMPAADSLPRIDLVCEMPYDQGVFGADAQHGPKYIVVTGDPNASPSIPALPADVADANVLARIARGASDNTIATADITDLRKGASLHGTARVMFAGDALADWGFYHGEERHRIGTAHIDSTYVNAGYVHLVDRWDQVNGTWRGTQPLHLPKPTILNTASLGGNATFTLATVSIPDPGWPYRLDMSGSLLQAIVGGATTALAGVYLQFNTDSTSFTPAGADLVRRTVIPTVARPAMGDVAGRRSSVLTGAHSVSFIIRNESNPSNFITWDDNAYAHCSITVLPA